MLVTHLWEAVAHPRGHHCHQNASWSLQSEEKAASNTRCEADDLLPNPTTQEPNH